MESFIAVHDHSGNEHCLRVSLIEQFFEIEEGSKCAIVLLSQGNEVDLWFEASESYEEVKSLLLGKSNKTSIISNTKPRKPLTMKQISTMINKPLWSKVSGDWYLVSDYTYGNMDEFVSLINKYQKVVYLTKQDVEILIKPLFYDIDSVTEIDGGGDLLYCKSCHGDLAPAYIENFEHCPNCGKIFTNIKDFRNE